MIFGVDVTTGLEFLVFDRDPRLSLSGIRDQRQVLRVSIDGAGEDLELLLAACQIFRGHHDYDAESFGTSAVTRASQ